MTYMGGIWRMPRYELYDVQWLPADITLVEKIKEQMK